jgi:hypothetical protein
VLASVQLIPVHAGRALQPPDVRYRLRARVDDSSGLVTGTADIRYRHLGADTLRSLTLLLGRTAAGPNANHSTPGKHARAAAPGVDRVFDLRLDGTPAALSRPGAPGSDTASVALARPLLTGDSVVLTLGWTAATHAGRAAGRRVDLIGWYPRLRDMTSRTTIEFPAFATQLVQLDLAADQVIGGTGVPLCGDPGWVGAAASPRTRITLQRDAYPNPRDPRAADAGCGEAGPGRKRVTWYAEDVTELAFAFSPTFRYEEGDFEEHRVHTLYERGRERVWGAGLASGRAETALAWVAELGGRNPWPGLTVVQGTGGGMGGEALPMVLVTDTPSQAALLGLLGLMMTQQVLAGGDPVFTVGTAAYQVGWFLETLGRRDEYARLEREILDWDLDRLAEEDEPLPPADAGRGALCASTDCRRSEFMLYQLRRWVRNDDTVRTLYRTLFNRFKLRPTIPRGFQRAARALIRPDPGPLFDQLPHGGTLYDDAIAAVRRAPRDGGGWSTTVVVERRAAGRFPQELWVVADSDTTMAHATALAPRESLTVVTRTRPRRVMLDPRAESHDWNMLNNQRGFGFEAGWLLLSPQRPMDGYLDTYFSRHTARDRLTLGWAPGVWYNDGGGWTFGARLREDYLGRFELNEVAASLSTGLGVDEGRVNLDGRLRLRNPVALRAPGWSEELGVGREEGRASASLSVARRFRTGVSDSTLRSMGLAARWVSVTDPGFVDRRVYDDAGTLELILSGRLALATARWPVHLDAAVGAGYGYPNRGSTTDGGVYARATIAGSVRGAVSERWSIGARVYGGAVLSADPVPRQRRIYLAGADPNERLDSPFLRSRGSLFAGSGFFYHAPGGAGVRGFDPRLSGNDALGATGELEYAPVRRPPRSILNRIAVAAFSDGGLGNGDLDSGGSRLRGVADAGVGLRLGYLIGQTRFVARFDLPLWVSRPDLAQDDRPGRPFGFRWSVSFAPAF